MGTLAMNHFGMVKSDNSADKEFTSADKTSNSSQKRVTSKQNNFFATNQEDKEEPHKHTFPLQELYLFSNL